LVRLRMRRSSAFVDGLFEQCRERFGTKRKSGARKDARQGGGRGGVVMERAGFAGEDRVIPLQTLSPGPVATYQIKGRMRQVLRDVRCVLVGDGPLREKLQSLSGLIIRVPRTRTFRKKIPAWDKVRA
jgi:hypothetical protein